MLRLSMDCRVKPGNDDFWAGQRHESTMASAAILR